MSNAYDVVILGAGPGGYAAAGVLAGEGKRVALVEAHRMGGVCLNYGCIPAKALLRSAEGLAIARKGSELGWSGELNPNYETAVKRSREVVDTQVNGMSRALRRSTIDVIEGRGRFVGERQIEVTDAEGKTRALTFEHSIIATGATAVVPTPFVIGQRIVTYREHIIDEQLPDSVLVVGAGAIGLEMADVMAEFGAKVTVVELADQVLPREDPRVAEIVTNVFRDRSIEVLLSTQVTSAVEAADRVTVELQHNGETRTADFDRVLVATGFTANTADLGLEHSGVARDERGAIVVDESMRTSAPQIFAVGDVTMRLALAHVAEAQGRVAADTILNREARITDEMYTEIPRVSYMQPQVASVGLREAEAQEQYDDVRSVLVPFARNSMAYALGDTNGFVKLLVHGPHAEIAGAHIVGHNVGELIPELALAIRWNLGAAEIADAVHAHPSLSETIQDAVREILAQ